MSYSVITFPLPPPTSNTLTSTERSKLLRSAAKLEKVLGSTPHVLDETCPAAPVHIQWPAPSKERSRGTSLRPCSEAGTSEDSNNWRHYRVNSPDSSSSQSSRSSTSSRSSSISNASTSSHPSSIIHEESWRVRDPSRRPPLLRLGLGISKAGRKARVSPELDTIPGSPPSTTATFAESEAFSSFTDSPKFGIQSDASLRRDKMRRLTKKLGEGVPISLVFPPSVESDDEDVLIDSPTSSSPSSAISSASSLSSISPYSSYKSSCYSPSSGTSDSPLLTKSPVRLHFRHEASHQPPRRSHYVKRVPVPEIPRGFAGRLEVHYESPEEHGLESETFEGLKCLVAGSV